MTDDFGRGPPELVWEQSEQLEQAEGESVGRLDSDWKSAGKHTHAIVMDVSSCFLLIK